MIVGGGDSAMEEAMFLSKFASKVTVVHRRDEFRASKIMLDRARALANIELLTPYTVEEFVPGENGALGHARARATPRPARSASSRSRGVRRDRPRAAVRARARPDRRSTRTATSVTEGRSTRTNRPGVFAAGDLVDHTYRQAITAAGSGCQAALDAEWYLRDTPEVPTPEGMPEGDLAEAQWAPDASGAVSGRSRPCLTATAVSALELQQVVLAVEAARVAAEAAAAAQHAVAGDDDRDRVGAERVAGGARAARVAGLRGDVAVGGVPP